MLLFALAAVLNYIGSRMNHPNHSKESVVLATIYFLAFLAYIYFDSLQPFNVPSSHQMVGMPSIPTYSMATPATPVYQPSPSPMAASYTPPPYDTPQYYTGHTTSKS